MSRQTCVLAALLVAGASSASAQSTGLAASSVPPQLTQPVRPQTSAFPPDARVAVVNVDMVASLSSEGKAAAAKLDDLRSKKSAEVSARGKAVEALEAKLAQSTSIVDDAGRVRLQREFERARIDFQRFTADAQAEVQDAQRETIRWFNSKLFPIVNQLATEKKLWAIFNADDALWYDPAIDLTEEVARRLDAATASKR